MGRDMKSIHIVILYLSPGTKTHLMEDQIDDMDFLHSRWILNASLCWKQIQTENISKSKSFKKLQNSCCRSDYCSENENKKLWHPFEGSRKLVICLPVQLKSCCASTTDAHNHTRSSTTSPTNMQTFTRTFSLNTCLRILWWRNSSFHHKY